MADHQGTLHPGQWGIHAPGERQATGALDTYLEGSGVQYGVVHPNAL